MVDGSLGNEEIGNGSTVPHAVMVCKVLLQSQCPLENVRRRIHDLEARMQIVFECVVVLCRAGRVELFELTDRTDEQESRQGPEFSSNLLVCRSRRGAFVENPAV